MAPSRVRVPETRIVERNRGRGEEPECGRGDVARQANRREAVVRAARERAALIRADAGTLAVVVLPDGTRDIVPLPASRRTAFERHLEMIIAQAAEEWAPLLPPRAETDAPTNGLPDADAGLPVLAAGCGFCRGYCCRTGGDTAWLEVATIQRVLSDAGDEPDFGALRDAYLHHLPAASNEDSCVYHAEHGCTLPREMRSNICNRFACAGLADLAARWKETGGHLLVSTDALPHARLARTQGPHLTPLP